MKSFPIHMASHRRRLPTQMANHPRSSVLSLSLVGMAMTSCGSEPVKHPPIGCNPADQSGCASDMRCENVVGGSPACFEPFLVNGAITDIQSNTPIANARLVAVDASGNAFSAFDVSNVDGTYSLAVPVQRDSTGKPTATTFTLRVDAQGYDPFPKAPRSAPVLDVANAKAMPANGMSYALQTADTDMTLIAAQNAKGTGMIGGTVASSSPGGTMVLAGERTGVADANGAYVVFNVAPGDAKVQAFKKGFNFDIATTSVMSDMQSKGIDFSANGSQARTVTGSLAITNGGMTTSTSVMLVLEDTFDNVLDRGDSPAGLEITGVNGAFTLEGVPNGSYAVLAAFENDGVVRSPDTSVMGSPVQHIVVADGDVKLAQPINVVGALGVVGLGAVGLGADGLDMVTGAPMFGWNADQNADNYRLDVFDAYGTMVWSQLGVFSGGSGQPIAATYGGPTLTHGTVYQFRATSLKAGTPLTATEDLAGAFLYQ